jgi:hypothetical protein
MRVGVMFKRVFAIVIAGALGVLGSASPAMANTSNASLGIQRASASAQVTQAPVHGLDYETKTFTWGTIRRGDCVQEDGVLVIDSDGKATYTANVWTNKTHTKDIWWSYFHFKTSGGRYLYNTPAFRSEAMDANGERYHINWTFYYDSDVFPVINVVGQHSDC